MRFTIITYIQHSRKGNSYFSYAPYIREMDLWLKQFEEVEIVAPLSSKNGFPNAKSYSYPNLELTSVPSFNLLNFKNFILSVMKIPVIIFKILGAMKRSDHIHLRCPGNIGLIACFLQIFYPKKRKSAKYAGNWDPDATQPWSYRLQRWLLRNTFLTKNMKVLVYGEWPEQSANIYSFFTASFSKKTILEVQEKAFDAPYEFIFVGNLMPGKGLKMAVSLVQELQERGVQCSLKIYGDGPERASVQAYLDEGESEGVEFKGSQSLEELKEVYQRADFLILPSKSEGWPKAVAEAMFFGCIPIATAVSCVPWMLGNGSRGILLSKDFNYELEIQNSELERIVKLLKQPEEMKRMSEEAKEWSQQYTLERFEEGIREVLS